MEKKNLFSIGECLTVNLTDKNTVDMVALHETGHVIRSSNEDHLQESG